jgi:hypothetical protein
MYHEKLYYQWRFFERKAFVGCKSQIFVFGNLIDGRESWGAWQT